MITRTLAVGLTLLSTTPVYCEPTKFPEDAVVYIEVGLQTTDPASGALRITKIGEGSGFLISESGWIITAAHVAGVEVPQNAQLVLKGAVRSREAQLFSLEMPPTPPVGSDVALLRFPPGLGIKFPYLCVVKRPAIALRQKISAIGFPLGQDFSVRPGDVTSLSAPKTGLIQTNLGLARGMSGGPVLDEHNSVVGVIYGGFDGQRSFDYFTPVNLGLTLFDIPPASYVEDSCAPPVSSSRLAATKTSERSYPVDETYDDHPGLAETTHEFVIRRAADPDTVIIDARLVRTSDTRVSDQNITIAPDRKSVEVRFKLTAGPAFDRWRGWLHGRLILTMKPSG